MDAELEFPELSTTKAPTNNFADTIQAEKRPGFLGTEHLTQWNFGLS
jgi:hypothetical protein